MRLLPSYVIDGGYLHGPRRAAVGVAVKPPDEGFRRLETTPRTVPYPVPTHTVYDPNPWRGMTDGCSRQVVSLGPYLAHRYCSPPPARLGVETAHNHIRAFVDIIQIMEHQILMMNFVCDMPGHTRISYNELLLL